MDLSKISKDTRVIITSGCSYSILFSFLYPRLASQNIIVVNLGEGGRSNKWIANSIIYALEQLKTHPRENLFVVGMCSSVDRQDLIVDKFSNETHTGLDLAEFADPMFFTDGLSYRQYKWYKQVLDGDNKYDGKRRTGLLSMTNLEKNPDSQYFLEKFAGMYYKYFYTKLGLFENTLTSMISLQSYCKLNNIKYTIMTWQDIFYDTSLQPFFIIGQSYDPIDPKRSHLCKYHKMAKRIDVYPELRYLYDQLDFSNWWFNNTDRCATGGLADWCIENGPGLFGSTEDFIHPTVPGYKAFVERVLAPHVLQKTGWSTQTR